MTLSPLAPGDRRVPWLDQCPTDWQFKPVKYLCAVNKETLPETADPGYLFRYLDISSVNSNGSWLPSEPVTFEDAPSRARRIVQDGDVLISTVRTYLRAITYLRQLKGSIVCSTGFAALTAGQNVHPGFLAYWVRSNFFVDEIVARSVGVSYPAINAADIGNLPFPCISVEKQRAIATFLDRETKHIDTLIAKKERQIQLLQEKRAALISQVVTKGLNRDAEMKDSGIEWIGEIPKHWKITKLKRIVSIKGRIGFRGYTVDDLVAPGEGALTIGGKHINDRNELDLSDPEYLSWDKFYESPEISLKKGDVVFVQRGSLGKVAVIRNEIGPATINPSMILLTHINADVGYFFYLLACDVIQSQVVQASFATAVPMISQELLGCFSVTIPPFSEQRVIAAFLGPETKKVDALVGKIQDSITALREYRTALISAAVTGKIDVRKEVDT